MENNEVDYSYLIPANVSEKAELFPGLTYPKAGIIAIVAVIGIVLVLLTGLFTKTINVEIVDVDLIDENFNETFIDLSEVDPNLLSDEEREVFLKYQEKGELEEEVKVPLLGVPIRAFVFFLFPTAFTYYFIRKDPMSNVCVYERLQAMKNYHKSQKVYKYQYLS